MNASFIPRPIRVSLFAWSVAIAAVAQHSALKLIVVNQNEAPVITVKTPGAEGIGVGFEGGTVVKLKGSYHLFVSEMLSKPVGVKMRLAHWMSSDRVHWKRIATLYESSGDHTGKDPRAALWAPMPIYNEQEGRWNLFYVAYRSAPNTREKFLDGYEGKIWRAASKVAGPDGIGGPYEDVGIILQPGPESQSWAGLQGTDSFFPYKAGDHWYGFYGTAETQKLPVQAWRVGLASAPELTGPWKRLPTGNPVMLEKIFVENPVVSRLKDGTYAAVYDCPVESAVGYAFSRDGVHWEPGQELIVQPQGAGHWAYDVRTPLALIAEGNGTFTLFYTGLRRKGTSSGDVGDYAMGLATVKLDPSGAVRP